MEVEIGDEGANREDHHQQEHDRGVLVYITRTGSRYHLQGCTYLLRSCIPIMSGEAEDKGYVPCRVCVTKTAKPIWEYRR